MKLYINHLLFAFLNISISIRAQNRCPSSHCGSGDVAVHYPFKFEHETPSSSINCTYFNLSCNQTSSTAIVNLPGAGEFYVKRIDYAQQYIQLYDPRNCLIKRLFDLRLESSPFKAVYDNYTLYVCSLDFDMDDPILCLSNSTKITVVARGSFLDDDRCEARDSRMLPVGHDDVFLYLTWDSDDCIKCKESDRESGIIGRIVALALTLPGLIVLSLSCCSVFCFHLMKMIGDKYAANSAEAEAPAPPSTTNNPAGLDESKIVGCTELAVVSESNEGNSKSCSICLESYCEKETVRVISKCGHCFHANCIHQWLGKNATCPVCRTSLSDLV